MVFLRKTAFLFQIRTI